MEINMATNIGKWDNVRFMCKQGQSWRQVLSRVEGRTGYERSAKADSGLLVESN